MKVHTALAEGNEEGKGRGKRKERRIGRKERDSMPREASSSTDPSDVPVQPSYCNVDSRTNNLRDLDTACPLRARLCELHQPVSDFRAYPLCDVCPLCHGIAGVAHAMSV